MPYSKLHAARLAPPHKGANTFTRQIGEGLFLVYQETPTGYALQGARASAEKVSLEAFKQWLREQGLSPLEVHPATLTKSNERADTPAEPHEQIRGSDKNAPGSARSRTSGEEIELSEEIERALEEKAAEHNEDTAHAWQRVTPAALKAVWRRGAGAFSATHRPSQNRQSWAYARTNAFLEIARGKGNPRFTQDDDLLHRDHPRRQAKK